MSKEYLDPQGFETAMQTLKEKLDDRYAKESDIPTKTSDLDNDSGFITEVTSSDVVDALGYTPADTNDVPTKTSDLTNDSDFVSDASYVHTDNNYTTAEKTSVGQISGIKQDLTQLSNEALDIKMLGWSVPKECPIQNYMDANRVFHQRVGRVDLGSLSGWTHRPEVESGVFSCDLAGIIAYKNITNVPSFVSSSKSYIYAGTVIAVLFMQSKQNKDIALFYHMQIINVLSYWI